MECQKINQSLQRMSSEQVVKVTDPLVTFRMKVLKDGAGSIKSIARMFRVTDRDKSHSISFEEFKRICLARGMKNVSANDLQELFAYFDRDGSGQISYDEFLRAVRPPMEEDRKALVRKAFAKMDRTGDGVITVEDLIKTYDVSKHPKYISGEKTKRQVIEEFLKNFEADEHFKGKGEAGDGVITKEEWMDYFCAVSASIDTFPYFQLMMHTAWQVQ